MNDTEIIALAIAAPVTALVLTLAHYVTKPKEPGKLESYTWGTSIMTAGFTGWRLACGDWATAAGLWAIVALSGLAVLASHGWDRVIKDHEKVRMAERQHRQAQAGPHGEL